MTPESTQSQIRRILDRWADAVRAKDSKALTANFAPDVVVFDLIDPLKYDGLEALKQRAAQWLSAFQGPVSYETEDLRITTGDDVAFCHSLNHVKGTTVKGKIDMRWRATVCFQKIDGQWTVTHEHSSVPFNMETGQASLDLRT